MTFEPEVLPRRFGVPQLVAAVGVMLLLYGIGGYLFFTRVIPKQHTPDAAVSPARRSLPNRTGAALPNVGAAGEDVVPSFVPAAGRDQGYGESRPGWERYVSPSREFLVYRQQGKICVLQIIAVKRGALDDSFLASVLREFAGTAGYRIVTAARRGGYLIEEGRTATSGDIVIYRTLKRREIRGVVVARSDCLPSQH